MRKPPRESAVFSQGHLLEWALDGDKDAARLHEPSLTGLQPFARIAKRPVESPTRGALS
jgi:hypothetical protein